MIKRAFRTTYKVLPRFQKRYLDLYEYHAKELFTQYGVRHQRGFSAETVDEAIEKARQVVEEFEVENIIVKAQVMAGGRGKGYFDTGYQGGVKFCSSLDDVQDAAINMLGNNIVTVQTPPGGINVRSLFIAECLDFDPSTEGGVEIEEVAKVTPEKIHKVVVDVSTGPTDNDLTYLADALEIADLEHRRQFFSTTSSLYTMLMEKDLLMVEINPMVHGEDGIICLDAKVNVDDNAEFRQSEIFDKRDLTELDPKEVEATKFELQYIALEGNIGCLVNGAGLAMSTMDIIKLHGGEPANFLDVGGGADVDQVREAFRIITLDENVQAILVNIFGGIMKCDIVAQGIIEACEQIDLKIPLVVRLEGTNAVLGKKMLADSGLNITTAADLDEAAKFAVAVLK